jgi:phage gp29-like protein
LLIKTNSKTEIDANRIYFSFISIAVLDVAMLEDGVKSIINIGKNLPRKFSIGKLNLAGLEMKIPVLMCRWVSYSS